eukprot:snap_masked-scaffold_46-processed-gene-1.49-mRNA-1 protein AED:1.00 eAED:1.00 QI:0/-1/0/0/-1/1/1/0/61
MLPFEHIYECRLPFDNGQQFDLAADCLLPQMELYQRMIEVLGPGLTKQEKLRAKPEEIEYI